MTTSEEIIATDRVVLPDGQSVMVFPGGAGADLIIAEDPEQGYLGFWGRLLAQKSSHRPGKERWIELAIYDTTGMATHVRERLGVQQFEGFVLVGCGKSTVEGETDRPWWLQSPTREGIIRKLTLRDRNQVEFVPRVSQELLAEAGLC